MYVVWERLRKYRGNQRFGKRMSCQFSWLVLIISLFNFVLAFFLSEATTNFRILIFDFVYWGLPTTTSKSRMTEKRVWKVLVLCLISVRLLRLSNTPRFTIRMLSGPSNVSAWTSTPRSITPFLPSLKRCSLRQIQLLAGVLRCIPADC